MSAARRFITALFIAAVTLFTTASELRAQIRRDSTVDWLISANSEGEGYLRALQLVGLVPVYPWSVRAFSPNELRKLAPVDSHPWDSSFALRRPMDHWAATMPIAGVIYNSRLPYGSNDGAVWAGRGITTSLSAGVRADYGPLDIVLAPLFFRAENASYALVPNGQTGSAAFANAHYPTVIDLPQRFGNSAYQQFDPGQSSARITLGIATAGVSTANEFWGPAVSEPFLLGNDAAGFRHLFFGTAKPVGIGGVAFHVRALAGKLDASEFSATPIVGKGRYLSGLVGVVTIAQLPGLELGGGRLFHNYFADSTVTLGQVLRPIFHGLLKEQRATLGNATGDEPDNQLASVFGRWLFPASGMEVYVEYGRDDSAFDLRDLLLEPDHDAAYILGFRKGWRRDHGRLTVLSSEVFNDRLSHLDAVRGQEVAYVHSVVMEGHTERGQVLGAPDLIGGGGQTVTLETYTPTGRSSLVYSRVARGQLYARERLPGLDPVDVVHALTYEWTSLRTRFDITRSITAVYDLNRNFAGADVFNVRASISARAHW